MAQVIIYSSDWCPFCTRAKTLLSNKGVKFEEIRVDGKPDVRAKMAEKAKRTSVPQIWIDELHVGGCDELFDLERGGKLDALLAQ
ncbi:MAG: glutaredoxin 3 [Gammaproteobacteria bacterium]|nr:glutaredoxin 3 [Gammaproteobacteria bacterium]